MVGPIHVCGWNRHVAGDESDECHAGAGTVLPRAGSGRHGGTPNLPTPDATGTHRDERDECASSRSCRAQRRSAAGARARRNRGSRRLWHGRLSQLFRRSAGADADQHDRRHSRRRTAAPRPTTTAQISPAGTPTPRNTSTALAPCGGGDAAPSVSSTTPAAGATNVSVNSTIVINFSESVTAIGQRFQLSNARAGSPRSVHADGVARHDVHADADARRCRPARRAP